MRSFYILLYLLRNLSGTPIRLGGEDDNGPDERTACPLPIELNALGTIKFIEDCKSGSMNRLKIPIPPISDYYGDGEIPKICCPDELGAQPICLPSDLFCDSFSEEIYDYSYDGDSQEDTVVSELSTFCPEQYSQCTPVTRCGKVNPTTNAFCGMESDEPKVCCAPEDVQEESSGGQQPRFPDKKTGEARLCEDKTEYCSTWKQNGACSTSQNFRMGEDERNAYVGSIRMFKFMTLTCTQSCGWCGDKGCVDLAADCDKWSRLGYCGAPDTLVFMNQVCKESCGLCGFLSYANDEDQVDGQFSYSDIAANSFDCGRFKDLEDIKKSGVRVDTGPGADDKSFLITDPKECKEERKRIKDELQSQEVEQVEDSEDSEEGLAENFYCGATIINDRWLVTAAHCQDLFSGEADVPVQVVRGLLPDFKDVITRRKLYRHPLYKFPLLYNDIALIELGRRIIYKHEETGDSPSCLNQDEDVSGLTASIKGYGENDEKTGEGEVLLVTNTTLATYQDCQLKITEYLGSLKNEKKREKQRKQFCTPLKYGVQDKQICGYGNPFCYLGKIRYSGACKGDSGGPIEIKKDGKTTIVGVVSGSINCANTAPEWFTNVAIYRDWILCIINMAKGNKLSQDEVQNACLKYTSKPVQNQLDICQ